MVYVYVFYTYVYKYNIREKDICAHNRVICDYACMKGGCAIDVSSTHKSKKYIIFPYGTYKSIYLFFFFRCAPGGSRRRAAFRLI